MSDFWIFILPIVIALVIAFVRGGKGKAIVDALEKKQKKAEGRASDELEKKTPDEIIDSLPNSGAVRDALDGDGVIDDARDRLRNRTRDAIRRILGDRTDTGNHNDSGG